MSVLGLSGLLLSLSTVFGILNARLLNLPMTIGIMMISMGVSILIVIFDAYFPQYGVQPLLRGVLGRIDLPRTLLDGALSLLLFAGAMQVDLGVLIRRGKSVAALAILGTLLAVVLLAVPVWLLFPLFGLAVPFSWCALLGAILAPTDPVSVIGMLRRLGLPPAVQAIFAGESLFNDGVGVVIFGLMIGLATGETASVSMSDVAIRFLVEAVGGALLGGVTGWIALRLIRQVNDVQVELLGLLALATATYSLANGLHMSGPVAVVVAGMSVAGAAGNRAISEGSRHEILLFWNLLDEILNALLFLLIGFELLEIQAHLAPFLVMLAVIPLSVLVRGASVFLSTVPVHLRSGERGRTLTLLTWGGLRGGISVALALGLPEGEMRDTLLPICYGVVVFTIIVQGLTMNGVARRLFPNPEA